MKQKLAFLLAALLGASLLATACGTADSSLPQAPEEPAETTSEPEVVAASPEEEAGEAVTITFMEVLASGSRTAWLDEIIPAFEAANNITVEREVVPWEQAHDRLVTLAASGNLPDVLETPANWLSEFAAAGVYEDLQPYFDAWDGAGEMADIAIELGSSYNDTLYEMPYGLYIVNMMYRKDWLEEYNIEVPTTIEEYYEAIALATDADQNRYGYAFRGGAGSWGLLSTLLLGEMGTGDYFEEDNVTSTLRRAEAAVALQNFGDLYFNGYTPQDALNWGYAETVDSFTSGTTAFLIQDTEVIGICLEKMDESEFGTAMAPAGSDGNTYLIAGHGGFSMAANSQHKEEAWALISHLVSPEINAEWAQNSWLVPSNKGALETATFAEGLMAPVGAALSDPNVVLYSHPDYMPEWGEFYSRVSVDEVQAFLLGEQTATETLSNIADFLEEAQQNYLDTTA